MIKNVIVALALMASTPVIAAEASKPEATCGKTALECQKLVDNLVLNVNQKVKAIQTYKELLTEANDRLVGTTASQVSK